jgi:hypothetical protein
MKYSQFRLGNLLQDGVSKTLLKVIEVSEKDLTTYVIDRSMFPLEKGWFTDPIPITEEWLLKLGFITSDWDNNSSFRLMIGNNEYTMVFRKENSLVCEIGDLFVKDVLYVHQLQNIYFSLTGEELTIK